MNRKKFHEVNTNSVGEGSQAIIQVQLFTYALREGYMAQVLDKDRQPLQNISYRTKILNALLF